MMVLRPRTRMISIRLSEEEYLALNRLCSATNARSISDLARDAMQKLSRGADEDGSSGRYMDELRMQIRELNLKVEQLTVDLKVIELANTSRREPKQRTRSKRGH